MITTMPSTMASPWFSKAGSWAPKPRSIRNFSPSPMLSVADEVTESAMKKIVSCGR